MPSLEGLTLELAIPPQGPFATFATTQLKLTPSGIETEQGTLVLPVRMRFGDATNWPIPNATGPPNQVKAWWILLTDAGGAEWTLDSVLCNEEEIRFVAQHIEALNAHHARTHGQGATEIPVELMHLLGEADEE